MNGNSMPGRMNARYSISKKISDTRHEQDGFLLWFMPEWLSTKQRSYIRYVRNNVEINASPEPIHLPPHAKTLRLHRLLLPAFLPMTHNMHRKYINTFLFLSYLGMQFGGVRSTSQVANNFIGTGRLLGEPPNNDGPGPVVVPPVLIRAGWLTGMSPDPPCSSPSPVAAEAAAAALIAIAAEMGLFAAEGLTWATPPDEAIACSTWAVGPGCLCN